MASGTDRRQRLEAAKLYFVCDARPGGRDVLELLPGVLAAGVDLFQLRDKHLEDDKLVALGVKVRQVCADHDCLFFLNDRADLAAAVDADGVHVGQEDVGAGIARAIVGRDRLVGLSTHLPEQIDAAAVCDYISVGPVWETPTKPGRPATGVELVRYAAAHARVPFFAIGGIDAQTVSTVRAAGATRIVVVRALADAPDPASAARVLREALDAAAPMEATVG